jgi:hypothetical protein
MTRVPAVVIRRAWSLLVGASLGASLGCAGIPVEDDLVVPEAPEAPRMEPSRPDQRPALAEPATVDAHELECAWERVEPQRFAELVPPPASAECRPAPSRKRRAELSRVLRERWHYTWPDHAKLSIEHGCDRLDPTLSTVVFDGSSGHGGSLDLVRLDHRDDGDWDVTWIDYNQYWGRPARVEGDPWQGEAPGPSTLRRGVLPGERVDPMLRRVRELLALDVRELEPPPTPGKGFGAGFGSSRDFHVGLRLVDAGGHGLARHFAGYEGGGEEQALQLTLDLASEELWKVLGDDALVAGLAEVGSDDASIRQLLAGAFWAAREREPDYGTWYVRERLFGLVSTLGGLEHVPALLDAVRIGSGPSEERSRVSAINGIAAIVGFDVRYDGDGKPRPVKAVAAEVLAACDRR